MVQAGSLGGGLQLAKVTTALRLLDEAIRVLAQPVRTLLIAFEVGRHPSWVQRRFTASVGLYHSLVAGRLGQKHLEPALGYCLPSMQERAGMFGTPGEDRWWPLVLDARAVEAAVREVVRLLVPAGIEWLHERDTSAVWQRLRAAGSA